MSVTIETPFQITTTAKGKKRLGAPVPVAPPPPPPVPRVARLMALALHFEGLIRQGVVRDYADLARLGGVSRARITQIMNLLNLPPWRQEELLFAQSRDVNERGLRGAGEIWTPSRSLRHGLTQSQSGLNLANVANFSNSIE